jgi:hypothetical protein
MSELGQAWLKFAADAKDDAPLIRRHALDCLLKARQQLRLADGQVHAIDATLKEAEKWHSKDAVYAVWPRLTAASPPYDKAHPPLPTLLGATDRFHKEKNEEDAEFAFHVSAPNAYIVIDLKQAVSISRLRIMNAVGGRLTARARGMQVYLSRSTSSRGEEVWQARDAASEWDIWLPKLYTARYVTIAAGPASQGAFFHLRKVQVMGPE